jgi:hypothetical protein
VRGVPILYRQPVPRAVLGWNVITGDIQLVVPCPHRWQRLLNVRVVRDAGVMGDTPGHCVGVPWEVPR